MLLRNVNSSHSTKATVSDFTAENICEHPLNNSKCNVEAIIMLLIHTAL